MFFVGGPLRGAGGRAGGEEEMQEGQPQQRAWPLQLRCLGSVFLWLLR